MNSENHGGYNDNMPNEINGVDRCECCGAVRVGDDADGAREDHSDAAVLHRLACMLVDDPIPTVIMLLDIHPNFKTLEKKGRFFSAFIHSYDPKAKGLSEVGVHKALKKLDSKHPQWRSRHGKYGG